MLYDITILEPSMFFHYDHMTVIVSCDCDIVLDPTSRFPSIEEENKSGKKLNQVYYLQL